MDDYVSIVVAIHFFGDISFIYGKDNFNGLIDIGNHKDENIQNDQN